MLSKKNIENSLIDALKNTKKYDSKENSSETFVEIRTRKLDFTADNGN
jgi:hypothetical protein